MKLTLQTLTGTKYFLDVGQQDKVREVKVKIFHDLEIKSKVRLLWQNKLLDDGVTLSAQGITEDTTLQMVIEPDTEMKLEIKTFKKGTMFVEIKDSGTVLDLLGEVHRSGLLPTARVTDFYFGDVCLSDEKLPFYCYGINEECVINQVYEGSYQLRLINAREVMFLQYITVQGTDTVNALKEKVLNTLNKYRKGEQNELSEDEVVMFQNVAKKDNLGIESYEELDRETITIDESKIRPFDFVVFIEYGKGSHGANIKVNRHGLPTGTQRMHRLYNPESVYSLRLKIQHQLHIPYQKQEISVDGMDNPPDLRNKVSRDKFEEIVVKVLA